MYINQYLNVIEKQNKKQTQKQNKQTKKFARASSDSRTKFIKRAENKQVKDQRTITCDFVISPISSVLDIFEVRM